MRPTIDQIDIMVTTACPARCAFCVQEATYVPSPTTDAKFLDAVREHVADFHGAGGRKVVITGGEPLVALPRVLRVLQILGTYHFAVKALYTNGARLLERDGAGRSASERLAEAGLACVNLSVHHDDDVVNRRIFGLRDMPSTRAKAHHLRECGLSFRLNAVLQKGGLATAEDVTRYARWAFDLGATDIYIREMFRFTFAEPKGQTRWDPIPYTRTAHVPAAPIIETLVATGEFDHASQRHETAREKTEVHLRHRPTGRDVLLSSLTVGNESRDELAYLVVMPDGRLYRGWLGEDDRIETPAVPSVLAVK